MSLKKKILDVWNSMKNHISFLLVHLDDLAQEESSTNKIEKSTEITISKNGETKTYASLEAMPEEDRRLFEEAMTGINTARAMKDVKNKIKKTDFNIN